MMGIPLGGALSWLLVCVPTLIFAGGGWQQYEYSLAQHAQIRQVVAAHSAADLPRDVREKLNTLRHDLHALYQAVPRVPLPLPQQSAALSDQQRATLHQEIHRAAHKYEHKIRPRILQFCAKHDIDLLQDRHSLSFRIRLRSGWWVLKVRKLGYPLPFQNLSRLFYAHAIQKLIRTHGYDAIMPPQAYAYNIHGIHQYDPRRVECAFNDDTWWVIEPYISGLPAPALNRQRIQRLLTDHPAVLSQLQALIGRAGLWDIKDHNFFVLYDRGKPLLVFTDLEMPGVGGAVPKNFFHRSDNEVASNGAVGRQLLAGILTENHKKQIAPALVTGGALLTASVLLAYYRHRHP